MMTKIYQKEGHKNRNFVRKINMAEMSGYLCSSIELLPSKLVSLISHGENFRKIVRKIILTSFIIRN